MAKGECERVALRWGSMALGLVLCAPLWGVGCDDDEAGPASSASLNGGLVGLSTSSVAPAPGDAAPGDPGAMDSGADAQPVVHPSDLDSGSALDSSSAPEGPGDVQPLDLPAGAMPDGAEAIEGIDFFHRIVGKWSGTVSKTPLGYNFPMTVDFAPSSDGMIFGQFIVMEDILTIVWGFNIENYGDKDLLAYRNGGFLGGFPRDSRTQLVEHDASHGYYRFCAVSESGLPVNGCQYIEATYRFSDEDSMTFEVTTKGGEPHVHWEAKRTETHVLPQPFPSTVASQGNGSAPWPEAAGLN